MSSQFGTFLRMARDSIADPKGIARQVLALPYPRPVWWQALALLIVLSVLFTALLNALMFGGAEPVFLAFTHNPFGMLAMQAGLGAGMVFAMYHVGRVFGGTGSFDGALRMTVWVHFVMFGLQLLQIVILLIVPAFGSITGLVIMGLNLWMLTNFVAVLHGFRSLGAVFGMIIITFFAASFVLITLLSLFGFGIPMELSDV